MHLLLVNDNNKIKPPQLAIRKMSRLSSFNTNNLQTTEIAPSRLIRVEKRSLSLEKKLDTIHEENEGSHVHSSNEKTPLFGSFSKTCYTKQLSSVRAA